MSYTWIFLLEKIEKTGHKIKDTKEGPKINPCFDKN